PTDDPRRRRPDITLARERLGWEPRIPLEHGLDRTIAYFESVLRRDGARGRSSRAARRGLTTWR
ncbi:MAG TPA: SDR family NAD-dependent epimerase/dehydratase, partial [Beijerinckiaceae bacterium]|nr:SDR family NAD-dependent epimerase/dehydratase [Beijerinckiaceae bacterium]